MPCGFAKKFHRVSRSGKERTESVNHRIFSRSIILIVRVLTQQRRRTRSMQMPGGAEGLSHLSRYPMQPMPICDSFHSVQKGKRAIRKRHRSIFRERRWSNRCARQGATLANSHVLYHSCSISVPPTRLRVRQIQSYNTRSSLPVQRWIKFK